MYVGEYDLLLSLQIYITHFDHVEIQMQFFKIKASRLWLKNCKICKKWDICYIQSESQ
jgi:hypothetical protein